ncbi:S41 family peptidase [Bacillus piscicola]|uniref:S41 family peptidase n=1 Tax=Bacillus piscicola TaxID=1632684 RepID=UPI001F09817F|nr:S41 family peptidase [Bacillus piscicola]
MKWKTKAAAAVTAAVLIAGTGGVFAGMNISDGSDSSRSASSTTPSEEAESDSAASTAEGMDKIEQVYDIINEKYMEDVDEDKLIEGALSGMVEELGDPHSAYMDKETADEFTQSLESSFEGIGAEVSMVDDTVTIVSPFRDSPADKAGLRPNDQIVEVNGESTEGDSLHDTVLKIRGEKGTTVTLTVRRQGTTDPFKVEVKRDEIPVETVRSEVMEENGESIGYLELTSFSEDTAKEFETHLKKLEDQGIDGLVIDVRGNPGGFLTSVEEIGDLIIPGDKTVVQIEDPNGEKGRSISTLEEKKPYPIVGLIDKGSVSASEILAAALKEAGGYELVGETTYGKGTVQQSLQLGDGSELKLSMFKWLTPDGNWINEKGVTPTVKVKQPDYFYSAVLSPEDKLAKDDIGEQVEIAQKMLQGLGLDPGRQDGYYDENTAAEVREFQKEKGLEATGIINEKTASHMNQALLELIRDSANDRQLKKAIEIAGSQ